MPEHYSKATIQASFYCPKCNKETPHHVADGRRGGCMTCIDNQAPKAIVSPAPMPTQQEMFPR